MSKIVFKTTKTLAKSSVVKASTRKALRKFCKGCVKLPPAAECLSLDKVRTKLDEWHTANGGYTNAK